jgi:ABC-type nitrate/sulfonate/bicarbonate transport system permease component
MANNGDAGTGKVLTFGYNAFTLFVFFLTWTVLSWLSKSLFFPTPWAVFQEFIELARYGDVEDITLGMHVYRSTLRIFAGFAAACILGIPLGILMGLYPRVYDSTKSIIEPVRFIPPVAWIPLVIVLLVGFSRYAFIIWLGAFFPIFIGTLLSVKQVNPIHIDVTRSFGAKRLYIIRKIIIPSTLPDIFTGMRVGMGIGWDCIMASEMIGGENEGLGVMILKYAELIRIEDIIVGMMMIGAIGFLINEVFILVEKPLFKWKEAISIG